MCPAVFRFLLLCYEYRISSGIFVLAASFYISQSHINWVMYVLSQFKLVFIKERLFIMWISHSCCFIGRWKDKNKQFFCLKKFTFSEGVQRTNCVKMSAVWKVREKNYTAPGKLRGERSGERVLVVEERFHSPENCSNKVPQKDWEQENGQFRVLERLLDDFV